MFPVPIVRCGRGESAAAFASLGYTGHIFLQQNGTREPMKAEPGRFLLGVCLQEEPVGLASVGTNKREGVSSIRFVGV